jgi:hypothetical protein
LPEMFPRRRPDGECRPASLWIVINTQKFCPASHVDSVGVLNGECHPRLQCGQCSVHLSIERLVLRSKRLPGNLPCGFINFHLKQKTQGYMEHSLKKCGYISHSAELLTRATRQEERCPDPRGVRLPKNTEQKNHSCKWSRIMHHTKLGLRHSE